MANYDLRGLLAAMVKRAAAPNFPTGYSAGQLQQQGYELGSEYLRGGGISPDEASPRLRDAIVAAKGPTLDDLKRITAAQMRKNRRFTGASNGGSEMDRWKTWMAMNGGNGNVSNADYWAWKKQQSGATKAATAAPADPLAAYEQKLREPYVGTETFYADPSTPIHELPGYDPEAHLQAKARSQALKALAAGEAWQKSKGIEPIAKPTTPAPAPSPAPAPAPQPAPAPAAPAQAKYKTPTMQDLRGISREQMQQNRKWTAARNMNSEMDRWKTWMAMNGNRNASNDDYYAWKKQQGVQA